MGFNVKEGFYGICCRDFVLRMGTAESKGNGEDVMYDRIEPEDDAVEDEQRVRFDVAKAECWQRRSGYGRILDDAGSLVSR